MENEKKKDGINWEQRRWELAIRFALQQELTIRTESGGYIYGRTYNFYDFEESIEKADEFIEKYKLALGDESD